MNIYVPSEAVETTLPVMFWIYGGGAWLGTPAFARASLQPLLEAGEVEAKPAPESREAGWPLRSPPGLQKEGSRRPGPRFMAHGQRRRPLASCPGPTAARDLHDRRCLFFTVGYDFGDQNEFGFYRAKVGAILWA